ncbi:MAG: arsenate reductase family protein [Chitinophagaceae bacterium]|nr:MAG: arsenate reductase family protein [Chitinophagaceae bacterium]
MAKYTFLHNPRCRKSREALALALENGINPEIREYLKDPLNAKEVNELLNQLNLKPEDLVRKTESDFKENFKGKSIKDDEWPEIFAKFPKLIERPILIKDGKKAVIGRPPEKILDLI